RDRIRSHGVNVIGPIDHGLCRSIYFAGPDHLALEVATSTVGIDAARWIDPTTLEKAGITAEEAARFKAPAPYAGPSSLPQPAYDPSKPHMTYPEETYKMMIAIPDEVITKSAFYAEPPVKASV
ncbi:MAG: VOC family protein, partial [Hyphomonadaceae bacterium]|nr:VOC family protein [Hyphomonadaceae bacterium]